MSQSRGRQVFLSVPPPAVRLAPLAQSVRLGAHPLRMLRRPPAQPQTGSAPVEEAEGRGDRGGTCPRRPERGKVGCPSGGDPTSPERLGGSRMQQSGWLTSDIHLYFQKTNKYTMISLSPCKVFSSDGLSSFENPTGGRSLCYTWEEIEK